MSTNHTVTSHLIELARVLCLALDDSEEIEGPDGRGHVITGQHFDDICKALEHLEDLPNDKPGMELGPAQKAEWALRETPTPPTATPAPAAMPKRINPHAITRLYRSAGITITSRYSSTVGFECIDAPHITIEGLTPNETDRLNNPRLFGLRIELFDPTDPKEQA